MRLHSTQSYLRAHRILRRKKKIRRNLQIAFSFAGILIVSTVFISRKWFSISDLSIEGIGRTPSEQFRGYLESAFSERVLAVIPRRTMWYLGEENLAANIKAAFPTVREIHFERDFPQALTIRVEEYDAWGVMCRGIPEECFWIDRGGVAFESAPGFTGLVVPKVRDERIYDFHLGSEVFTQELMRLITFFNDKAPRDARLQSTEFIIDAEDKTIRVTTRAGWDILLVDDVHPEVTYRNLITTLESEVKDRIQELEYIDLRFGNKVFYKFRDD